MEYDQMLKRLEWLDSERRKDKTVIATLEDRLENLEKNNLDLSKQVKDLSSDVSHLSVMLARVDRLEGSLSNVQIDLNRKMDAQEKQRLDHNRESEKIRRADLESLNKSLSDLRVQLNVIPDIQKNLKIRVDEENRLGKMIEELERSFKEDKRSDEDSKRTLKILEEGRRQDAKRISDLQAEVSALRKRSDEQRGKVDLVSDSLHKLEVRMNDLQAAETERRQNQTNFIEKQNMYQVDRERVWKEWEAGFEEINQQSIKLNTEMQALDTTNRSLKRSQKAFEEITENFDRRVNEITEMQRLVEERFRQEWSVFKSDEQKRWVNYTMTQEEHQQEYLREFSKIKDRLVSLEDMSQDAKDILQQITQNMLKQLQKFHSVSTELLEESERNFGVS